MKKGYLHPVHPEKYPLFHKRNVPAVTRKQLGDRIQFVALRGFDTDEAGNLLNISETLDTYTKEFSLCDVVWPVYPTLFAPNFGELVEEANKRGLYMFDFWGYVPGSNPTKESIWGEYTPPEEAVRLLETMGDHFIGFDNGEQDGRYIGSYARVMCPASDSRRKLYQNFQAHFEKLEGHMRNNISLLASLHFLHAFAKGGNTSILGAETAQALPNANVWFSFIRGAGKQYGLLWFGNASVWNRWGWKNYDKFPEDVSNPYEENGYECGTSLSLLRRLLYLEYFYGSDLLGFEAGWLLGDDNNHFPEGFSRKGKTHRLSPVGMLQEDMYHFVEKHPDRGVLYTPVCIYLDFYNGFVPPRHLYSSEIYRVWGSHAYERGDHQLHVLLSMLYPGYEDSGFFRNEKGFLTATPYGDIADIIFSDTEAGVLDQYELAIVCGDGALDAESQGKLLGFAQKGGTVLLFGNKLSGLREELLCKAGDTLRASAEDGSPLVLEKTAGTGRVINILTDGLLKSENPSDYSPENKPNQRIAQPYSFAPPVEGFLDGLFKEYLLFAPDNSALGYTLNALAPDRFLLAVYSESCNEEKFSIIGENIQSVTEWEIPDVSTEAPGYYPKAEYLHTSAPHQADGDYAMPPMGIRVFEIQTSGPVLEAKPEISFPKRDLPPVYAALAPAPTLQDAYLDIPWFENYFAGAKIDARYFEEHDPAFLEREGAYLQRRNCQIIVDFSPMLNHYPDLSLIRNIPGRTEESIRRIHDILEKSRLYGCTKAIFTLHRNAENMLPLEEADRNMRKSLGEIAAIAKGLGITLYLENGRSLRVYTVFSDDEDVLPFLNEDWKLAYSTAHGFHQEGRDSCPGMAEAIRALQPAALLLAAPSRDEFGQFTDLHLPLSQSQWQGFALPELPNKPDFICLDAVYSNADQLFADYQLLLS